ncbi:transposase [Sulfitobacter sp. M22298]|uniref:transposase n=1 Tax=Sulfitobacter sp. M22298 TaxID=3368575 RepID=UPI0037455250
MQKALMEMNVQLHHVVSDITGVTGMKIIRAIVAGERDLDVLAAYRDVRCKASTETIKAALNGNDRPEHIFELTQSLELYDFYQAKMLECDRHLEATLAALGADTGHDPGELPHPRTKTRQVSTPSFDVRAALFNVLGVDLTQIHGMGPSLSLKLVGECGTDLRAWPSAKHFTSWLCLAPATRSPAGRSYHLGRAGHQVVLRLCCDWQRSRSVVATPPLVRSIDDWLRALAKLKLSQRQRARSPFYFTTPSDTA